MTGFLDAPPLAFAHRGGSGTAGNVGVENSLAAFAHAYELGYRYLETDVRMSSDGVVYAIHDAALDRLSGSPDLVAGLSAESLDLQRLDQREPFARLDALYEAFPDARLNIDVKSDDAVEATCAVVEAHDAVDRTCLSSFSHARLVRIRTILPAVATSASRREVAAFKLLPRFLLRPKYVCLQVPAVAARIPRRHAAVRTARRTRSACRCTCGRSTSLTRCTSSSTSASTASSPTAPTSSRTY